MEWVEENEVSGVKEAEKKDTYFIDQGTRFPFFEAMPHWTTITIIMVPPYATPGRPPKTKAVHHLREWVEQHAPHVKEQSWQGMYIFFFSGVK